MNQEFTRFLKLSVANRIDVFEAEAERLDTLASYVEKDFWVCWILDVLYNGLPKDRPRILFKGGTSLSKVYGLIERFSEDVDFTIFAEDLGFPRDLDDEAIPGSFCVAPTGELLEVLRKDYQAMQGMMLGRATEFQQIINRLSELEAVINNP